MLYKTLLIGFHLHLDGLIVLTTDKGNSSFDDQRLDTSLPAAPSAYLVGVVRRPGCLYRPLPCGTDQRLIPVNHAQEKKSGSGR